jgi:EAL domain-containing protein (putative c-di-GMP-specific phosphodiesterase class I)
MNPSSDPLDNPSPHPQIEPSATDVERVCTGADPVATLFEPVVDLSRGAVCGYEALTRFPAQPELDIGAWFRVAGELERSARLETIVVASALSARGELPAGCFLSINLSPAAIVSKEVTERLEGEGDLDGVVLEVTEQTPVTDSESMRLALAKLRDRGASLAVDDVGEGYSTLRHVVSIRPQFVKIDRSIITGIDCDPAKVAAVEAVSAFASKMNAWVVAEGVERLEELDTLIHLGVPLAQGFLFGRPSEEMQQVDAVLAEHIHVQIEAWRRGGVRPLLTAVAVAFEFEGQEALRKVFSAEEAPEWVPILDDRSRPVGVAPSRDCGDVVVKDVMVVHSHESAGAVALRAMTREPGERLTPLACCDGRGRYLALLPVERVVEQLASTHDRPAPEELERRFDGLADALSA